MPAAFAGITPPLSMQKTCKQLNFQNQMYCDHKRAQSKLRRPDFEQITLAIVSSQWRVKIHQFFRPERNQTFLLHPEDTRETSF